ncbi:helix-turn-helix transcriptional regulator [Sphingomonas nostoxanthinifaciens]|uniref:helix-turn-helix transcriptional regulator n=1 Tax=Sphingomonas nostoxanthinifaciens TaxID=2872652 RepID=UPI001CC1EBB4|nr:helix-turn-helix transcriptional regulator [Sphingomonas nostoxanthinifaciens]UAK25298.1 helix-turn-helix transcriptional regulator [Sphingomonas nostoxanthinifaciens]
MVTAEALGHYLRDRRSKIDAKALGYGGRRRTPGLRREEVAQRAGISATWYSWLEQGRGGAPSAHTLEQVASALMLSRAEREHLFLIALGHLPERHPQASAAVPPRLQMVIDALESCPALIRDASWNVVAWNAAQSLVMTDWAALPSVQRNLLRAAFLDRRVQERDPHWNATARFLVSAFRSDIARNHALELAKPLIEELCQLSPEFAKIWAAGEVNDSCEGIRCIHHDLFGLISFQFSGFMVDGRADLVVLVYSPALERDLQRIKSLVRSAR